MNVLIFSDPFIENGKPLLRHDWADFFIKNIVSKINHSIQSGGEDTEIIFFGNEILVKKLEKNQNENLIFKFIAKENIIKWDHKKSLEIYKKNSLFEKESNELTELTVSAIGENWRPDLIIALTPADWLSTYYKCEHIFYEAGLFSRAPFPGLTQWDPYPNHWHEGFLFKNFHEIQRIAEKEHFTQPRKRILRELRSLFKAGLKKKYDRNILNPGNLFEYIILLPLQFSSSIAFDSCCGYKSQIEFLEDILNRIDSRIGVVVTTHNFYENPITLEIDARLKKKYKNYIRLPAFDHDPVASQEILLEVDAVVAVSTAVSLQAFFWNIPVLTVGDSYMRCFSIQYEVEDLLEYLESGVQINNDSVIYWLLTNYYIPLNLCLSDELLHQHLVNLISLKNGEILLDEFKSSFNELDVVHSLIKNYNKYEISAQDKIVYEKEFVFIDAIKNKNHQIISFDIFDTLIERPFAKPSHLFAFMQKDVENILGDRAPACFMTARIYAENEIARKLTNKEDVTLDEIYSALQDYLKVEKEAIEKIKEIEIDLEVNNVLPREFVRKIFDLAIISGKRLILISDMYLPKYVIEAMLVRCGYPEGLTIYLSCEVYKTKSSCSLYEYVEKIEGVDRKNWLHIGDNLRADINNARNMGINALYAPKAVERFLEYPQAKKIFQKFYNIKNSQYYYDNFIVNSVSMGLLSRKVASNPYHIYTDSTEKPDLESLSRGKADVLGYLYGPMFFGFSKWVLEQARRQGVKHLLFLSRDGYFPYEIFKKLDAADISASYLYCSRKTVYLASVETYEDILGILKGTSFSKGTVKSFFQKKFDIELDSSNISDLQDCGFSGLADEIFHKQGFEVDQRLQLFLKRMQERIFEKAELFRKALLLQIRNSTDENFCDIGVVDIGCSTSMQFYLQKTIKQDLAHGFYFIKNHLSLQYRDKLHSSGFLSDAEDQNISRNPYFDNIEFFETIFSAPHGSVSSFDVVDSYPIPIFLEDFCLKKGEFSEKFHIGVLSFVDDFLRVTSSKLDYLNFSLGISLNLQFELITNPGAKDAMCLDDVEFENDFGGFVNTKLINYSRSNMTAHEIIGGSVWKPGANALFRYVERSNRINKSNHFSVEKISKEKNDLQLKKNKKWKKLKKNPYLFFKDSKNKYVRMISYFIPKRMGF